MWCGVLCVDWGSPEEATRLRGGLPVQQAVKPETSSCPAESRTILLSGTCLLVLTPQSPEPRGTCSFPDQNKCTLATSPHCCAMSPKGRQEGRGVQLGESLHKAKVVQCNRRLCQATLKRPPGYPRALKSYWTRLYWIPCRGLADEANRQDENRRACGTVGTLTLTQQKNIRCFTTTVTALLLGLRTLRGKIYSYIPWLDWYSWGKTPGKFSGRRELVLTGKYHRAALMRRQNNWWNWTEQVKNTHVGSKVFRSKRISDRISKQNSNLPA